MNVNEIINIVNRAHEVLEEKGWYVYSFNGFNVIHGGRMEFNVIIRPPYNSMFEEGWEPRHNIDIKESCANIDDLNACRERFLNRVLAHATIAEYMQGRFRQKLVDLAEEGERLGFALEYVEVLRSTSKALASNALTSQK